MFYVISSAPTPHGGSVRETGFFPIHNSKGRQRLCILKCDTCWSFSRSYLSLQKNVLTTVPHLKESQRRRWGFWDFILLRVAPSCFIMCRHCYFFTQHKIIVKQSAFIFIASYMFRLLYRSHCRVKYEGNYISVVRCEISLTRLIERFNVRFVFI